MKGGRTRWVVALGLRDNCQGALELAGWLADPSRYDGPGDALLAAHVVSSAETALPERALRETIEAAGLTERFEHVRVVDSDDLPACLGEAVDAFGADAVLMGRRSSEGWPRLGGTGARLLRTLPAPMVVVPRDLRADAVPPGPILAATDLQDDSVLAVQFAAHLSRRYRRPLWVVHVAESTFEWSVLALSSEGAVEADAELRKRAEEALQAWVKDFDLSEDTHLEVLQGDVLGELMALVQKQHPLFTVIGSRRLSALERLFTTSIGAELANHAPYPVAVVPPHRPD